MIWFRAASNSIAKNRVLTALFHGRHSPYPPRSTAQILCCRLHSTAAERKPTNCQSNQQFNFLHGINSAYLEELYRSWESDPDSVDGSWDQFFRNLTGQQSGVVSTQTIQESMRLQLLIRAYQVNGHRKANLDPLGLQHKRVPAELDPNFYGFTEDDLDRHFFVGELSDHGGISPAKKRQVESLRNIMERLERLYCGSIGYEYMHIHDREKNEWIRERIERAANAEERRRRKVAEGLIWAAELEGFLGRKWPTAKRFGLEGGEAVVPAVERAVERAAELGVETAVFGMAHRGRINVLGNVMGKPLRQIFNEFMAGKNISSVENGLYTGTGDVKYHLGTSCDRPIAANATSSSIHLSLVPNPSHLEAVDPVVVGKTRAKQYYSNDAGRAHTMGFLIHGDGSFVGQGVVYETLHLSGLARYTTGGTVHVIINNQVAFTTDPDQGRSSHYCTDVAKALDAPVLHVNGDDVEAVVRALELAVEWRQRFRWDVVVDVVCYRRYGHNEVDDPSITHPTMYKVIWNHPTVVDLYKKRLVESGHVTPEEIDEMHDKINKMLLEEFEASKDYVPTKQDWLDSSWAGLKSPDQPCPDRNTGVKQEILKSIGKKVSALPKSLKAHKVVKKVYEQRAEMIDTGKGIDWATSEALAFGSLIREGFHVRLSGQDVERGTFSHRHAVIHDQQTGEKYCPLQHLLENQNPEMFTISNSSLSEYGVLGFEFGYSSENPNSLVLWEAQFGDFANGAQVVFDQFLSSGEAKWLRQSGLVVLLPHGYDGQGPEHSSGRLERFLQMCDDNPYVILPPASSVNCNPIQQCNWQVVNVTTPANYFHVLRRQIHRDFRKPLIVMSPKNLLRHKDCKSNLSEFEDDYTQQQQGPGFKRLIEYQNVHSVLGKDVRRLIFCSGKVYYELDDERRRVNRNDIVICRIEQLCPLPYELIQQELQKYPNAEVVWCQEEPMNMGAYTYISMRLRTAMKGIGRGGSDVSDVKYVGRLPSAATATGFYQVHVQEQTQLLQKALQFQPISFP